MAERGQPVNILLLGGSGQVGTAWRQMLAHESTSSIQLQAPARQELDLCDAAAVRAWVLHARPDLIVNAAAYTAVDKAESEPELAQAINAVLPTTLAQAAHEIGAALLHYSTDYVFSGAGTQPYRESDPVQPLSVYGQTKALGEVGVRKHLSRYLILRTSWVMGAQGGNFLKTMLRLAAERDQLRVVADQVGVPTPARLLALMGWIAWQHCAQPGPAATSPPPWGLYHVAPRGETNWCAYAQFVLREARVRGWSLKAGPEQVTPITTADYPTPAQRPANSRLDVSHFEQTFHVTLPPWQDGVRDTLDELRSTAA
jgi:dTDP-4-dehydrorhamnose reductase